MKPYLFEIFGIKASGYGLMIGIGVICAILLMEYRCKKSNEFNSDKIFNMGLWAILGGAVGGKLLYVIVELKNIINNPKLLLNFQEGFVIYGSLIGGMIAVIIYCKINKWNILRICDILAPSISLGQAFGRIGCLMAGCCYGVETHSDYGIVFKETPFAPIGVHLQPTQIYSSVFDFLLCFFLLYFSKKNKVNGRVIAMYLICYSVGRFLIEFIRGDNRGTVLNLSTSQFISIFTLILGFGLYFHKNLFSKRS